MDFEGILLLCIHATRRLMDANQRSKDVPRCYDFDTVLLLEMSRDSPSPTPPSRKANEERRVGGRLVRSIESSPAAFPGPSRMEQFSSRDCTSSCEI
jgi:hypothetical protein